MLELALAGLTLFLFILIHDGLWRRNMTLLKTSLTGCFSPKNYRIVLGSCLGNAIGLAVQVIAAMEIPAVLMSVLSQARLTFAAILILFFVGNTMDEI